MGYGPETVGNSGERSIDLEAIFSTEELGILRESASQFLRSTDGFLQEVTRDFTDEELANPEMKDQVIQRINYELGWLYQ